MYLSYSKAIKKYSKQDFLDVAKSCRFLADISEKFKISHRTIGGILETHGILKKVKQIHRKNRKKNPIVKKHSKDQFLDLAKESMSFASMGRSLDVTREYVRIIVKRLKIRNEVLKIFKKNKLNMKLTHER